MKMRTLFGLRLIIGLAVLGIAGVIVAFHDPLVIDDRPHIERVLKLAVKSVQADIAADLEGRVLAQVRLAQLGTVHELSETEWTAAARLFLAHHPGYVSVRLVDRAARTLAAHGEQDGPAMRPASQTQVISHALQPLLEHWTDHDQIAATTLQLRNGHYACLLIVPRVVDEKLIGFLVGVFDVQQTLEHTLADHVQLGYSVAVTQDGAELYRVGSGQNRAQWTQTVPLRLTSLNWQVEVWPRDEMLTEFRSRLPELGMIFALLLILLLGSTIHFARRTQIQSGFVRAAHAQLECRVQQRTAELKNTNQLLQAEVLERTRLSARILHLQDEERRRIARELHDSTAQILSALCINLGRLRQRAPVNSNLRALIQDSEQLSTQALAEIRTVSYLLHPPNLDDFGLASALQWYAQGFAERSGIEKKLEVDPRLGRFPAELELTLFRIVQEALGNVHRHSGSRTVTIALTLDGSQLKLVVSDQGRGFPPEALNADGTAACRAGLGIASMRERVRQFDGQLKIISGDGGTTVTAVVPLANPQVLATAA